MVRVFSYDTQGEGNQILECPNCGARTKARDITFTEEGNVILSTNKEGKPVLAYQVANPADERTYGKIIKIKQDKPKNDKKPFKKPVNKGNKKNGKKPFNKKKRKENNTE
jgi:hypothetical protein